MRMGKNLLEQIFVVLIPVLSFLNCDAQLPQIIDFSYLKKADYTIENIPLENDSFEWMRLIPGDELKALDNKLVLIEGYLVAIDPDSNFFVLSSFPNPNFWSCFVFNQMLTVVLVDLRASQDLSEYDPLTKYEFKGVLRLNTTDPYQMSLILEDAEPIAGPAVLKALHIEFKDLSQVKFAIKTDPKSGVEYEVAEFPESIQKLNGITISIEGYFHYMDDGGTYLLTDTIYNPLINCGKLTMGEEKIIELVSKKSLSSYEENSKQTFTGRLELNASDPYKFT